MADNIIDVNPIRVVHIDNAWHRPKISETKRKELDRPRENSICAVDPAQGR